MGVSATAGRNVPTKPIGLEKWRCSGFGVFLGGLLVGLFVCFKGLERAGRDTSQQCAPEPREEEGNTVKSIRNDGLCSTRDGNKHGSTQH